MAFRREIIPAELESGDRLTGRMAGIGMNFATTPIPDANIEDTLLAASYEGAERDDLRVLAILTTWFGVHHPRINADRLIRLVSDHDSARVRAFWSALSRWKSSDRRFVRLLRAYGGPRLDLLRVGNDFQIGRRGEDARFAGSKLRVPAGALRDRASDVLTPSELARRHRGFRARLIIGPSYRADAWAAYESAPDSSIADIARRSYTSFATAWQVVQDANALALDS